MIVAMSTSASPVLRAGCRVGGHGVDRGDGRQGRLRAGGVRAPASVP